MVADGLLMLETIFGAVVGWFSSLMDAIGGRVYVVAGFMILLVCGLLIAPIRGSALRDIGGGFSDFAKNSIHSQKQGYFSKARNHKAMESKRNNSSRNRN